jgi:hypothetical protein
VAGVAKLESAPAPGVRVVARRRLASNGHHPDVLPGAGAAVTNGAGELPGQGVAFGTRLHMTERRIDLHEADQ